MRDDAAPGPAAASAGVGATRRAARWGAGLVGSATAVVLATTVVRVQRLRRTAVVHAHELDATATVGDGVGEPVRLLVLGDSAARGYGLVDPAAAFPQQLARRLARATGRRVHVTSLATDGHRTADVLAEQLPLVRAARPDAVVVSVGVNDAIRVTARRDLAAATRDLLDGVGVAGDGAVVLLVACPDLTPAPGFPRPLNLLVGWRARRVARTQRRVAADAGVAVVELPRPPAATFGPDGFHPGRRGAAMMAALVGDALVARAGTIAASPAAVPDGRPTT